MIIEQLAQSIAEVKSRQQAAVDEHLALVSQFNELRQRGVDLEKTLLAIEGELKALMALEASLAE